MLKNGPQVSFEIYLETLKFSKCCNWVSVSWPQLWLDITRDPLRVSYWFLNQSCSPTIALQLSCSLFPLIRHGLRDQTLSILAVRLIGFTESMLQCLTGFRKRPTRGWHSSPAVWLHGHAPWMPWRCWPRCAHPRAPARPARQPIFHFFASSARSQRAQAAPPLPLQLRRRRARAPLQKRALHLHRSSAVFASTSSTT